MNPCIFDDAMFFRTPGQEFTAVCATYADDTLHVGNLNYLDLCIKTEKIFYVQELGKG